MSFIQQIIFFIKENESIFRIGGGIVIFLLLLIVRNRLADGILSLVSAVFHHKEEDKRKSLHDALHQPLALFFAVLGAFLGIYLNVRSRAVIKSFKIIAILIVCWALVNFLSTHLHLFFRFEGDDQINTTAIKFISNILKILIAAFGIVMIVSELGYNINGLITGIGVGGLAVSLAAQEAVSNLISGFVIILEKPFRIGDYIQTNQIAGTVMDISMRSTTIRTLENSVVTMPNSKLTNEAIINISRIDKRLIDTEYGIEYDTPNEKIEEFQQKIREYLLENELIVNEPMRVEVDRLDDYSINLRLFCYTVKSDIHEFYAVLNDVNLAVKAIAADCGVSFAFPTTTVVMNH